MHDYLYAVTTSHDHKDALTFHYLHPYYIGAAVKPIDPCKLRLCPAERQCESGQMRVILEGECCPVCQDCSTSLCPDPPLCQFIGESLQVPEGECCPRCVPDPCAGILCVAPNCLPGEVPIFPEDECCAVCVRFEEACDCEPGLECQFVLGQPTCVPQIPDPCDSLQCPSGNCQVIGGRAVCDIIA